MEIVATCDYQLLQKERHLWENLFLFNLILVKMILYRHREQNLSILSHKV